MLSWHWVDDTNESFITIEKSMSPVIDNPPTSLRIGVAEHSISTCLTERGYFVAFQPWRPIWRISINTAPRNSMTFIWSEDPEINADPDSVWPHPSELPSIRVSCPLSAGWRHFQGVKVKISIADHEDRIPPLACRFAPSSCCLRANSANSDEPSSYRQILYFKLFIQFSSNLSWWE